MAMNITKEDIADLSEQPRSDYQFEMSSYLLFNVTMRTVK